MLRHIALTFFLVSCSMGTIKTGGEDLYFYDTQAEYTTDHLKELSHKVVRTSQRDPQVGKLDELFGKKQAPLKRIGVIIFESEIQPTREGLAKRNMVYVSESGKQLMTEDFLTIWEQSLKIVSPDLDYVPMSKIKEAKSFQNYGLAEEDYIKVNRSTLAPDDIFFLESGKKTTTTTILNPRGTRDMSFLLVPAYELMGGPKWSEQNKQFVNDVVKELKLDAAIIVMSEARWTAAHTDKHSGELVPEEIIVKIKSSVLLPLSKYHERLRVIGNKATPNVTLCYRSYEGEIKFPALISHPEESKNFKTIQDFITVPVMKTYKDLAIMTIMNITEDLKRTW